jgi:hypothetical protein
MEGRVHCCTCLIFAGCCCCCCSRLSCLAGMDARGVERKQECHSSRERDCHYCFVRASISAETCWLGSGSVAQTFDTIKLSPYYLQPCLYSEGLRRHHCGTSVVVGSELGLKFSRSSRSLCIYQSCKTNNTKWKV